MCADGAGTLVLGHGNLICWPTANPPQPLTDNHLALLPRRDLDRRAHAQHAQAGVGASGGMPGVLGEASVMAGQAEEGGALEGMAGHRMSGMDDNGFGPAMSGEGALGEGAWAPGCNGCMHAQSICWVLLLPAVCLHVAPPCMVLGPDDRHACCVHSMRTRR
jgi:hypothetical protein